LKICATQVRSLKICSREIGFLEIGIPKILLAEVGLPEVNLKKILRTWWRSKGRLFVFGLFFFRDFSLLGASPIPMGMEEKSPVLFNRVERRQEGTVFNCCHGDMPRKTNKK
jgi:hypothetical protein